MSDQTWCITSLSGSNETIATGLGTILPNHKWPLWQGGYHLPEMLQDTTVAPTISGSLDTHDYHCPETYVISGGGIIGGVKQLPSTRIDNE